MKTVGAIFGLMAAAVLMVVVIAASVLFPSMGTSGSSATTTSCVTSTATGKLSGAQIAGLAYAAGWRGNDLTIAVAITMPESGADSTAVQNGGPIGAPLVGVGLWQITPGTQADLDPATNAAHAFAKYQGAGNTFSPWTTFVGGQYLAYMGWAAAGVAGMSTVGLSCQTSTTTSSVQDDIANANVGKVVVEATPPGLPATFDSYPWGQCTYWAAMHLTVPPFLGNAADWWANAAAKGVAETATPTVGSVVVYGAGNGYSSDGHVGYVIQVDSPTTFDLSEMNFMGVGIVDERTSDLTDVLGFIT